MEPEIVGALIGLGGGLVVGIPALGVAITANRKSSEANSIAKEAVTKAETANAIALRSTTAAEQGLEASLLSRWTIDAEPRVSDAAGHWTTKPVVYVLSHYGSSAVTNVRLTIGWDPHASWGGSREWSALAAGQAARIEMSGDRDNAIPAWSANRTAAVSWIDSLGTPRTQQLQVPHPHMPAPGM